MSERSEANKAKVDRWINENFDREAITVEDWPLLPAGKRIIDRKNDEMIVFYDWLRDKVEYRFPDATAEKLRSNIKWISAD